MADTYDPDADPRGANQLIRMYLQGQGLQPTSANVSRALLANAQNPGLIHNAAATLFNQGPPPAGAAPVRSGAAGLPVPPIPPGDGLPTARQPMSVKIDGGGDGGGSPTTSAPPSTDDTSLLLPLAAGGAGAALGTGLAALRRGKVAPGGGPDMDLGNYQLELNRPQIAAPGTVDASQPLVRGPAEPLALSQTKVLPGAVEPGDLGRTIVTGEPLAIGAPPPQLAAPVPEPRPVSNPAEPVIPSRTTTGQEEIRLRGPSQPIVQAPPGMQLSIGVPALPAPGTAPPAPVQATVPGGVSDAITRAVPPDAPVAPRAKAPRVRGARVRVP